MAKVRRPKRIRTPKYSEAVERARTRRLERANASTVRIEWFIDEVSDKVSMTMQRRIRMATEYLQSKVVKNISVPVLKTTNKSGRVVVAERSKPGEFPRADTTQLMKTIFKDFRSSKTRINGYVGTPLDYGLILETQMNRSFLVRTLREEKDKIRRMLTGPITGGRSSGFSLLRS